MVKKEDEDALIKRTIVQKGVTTYGKKLKS